MDKPPADVFDYLVKGDLRKQWVGGVIAVKSIGDPTPRVGAGVVETLDMGGQQTDVEDQPMTRA